MRYQIILEGKAGELDRREVETEEQIRNATLILIADCAYLADGDMVRVVDTQATRDDIDQRYIS
jgi:hypothetical protein